MVLFGFQRLIFDKNVSLPGIREMVSTRYEVISYNARNEGLVQKGYRISQVARTRRRALLDNKRALNDIAKIFLGSGVFSNIGERNAVWFV